MKEWALKAYRDMSESELACELAIQKERYAAFAAQELKLNMARGKPSPEQLDLSLPLLDMVRGADAPELLLAGSAEDYRNYGGLVGLPKMRSLMGSILGVPAANVIVGGNSSLSLMYYLVSLAMMRGVLGSEPWARLEGTPKFLCPAPGYDRHFAICEFFGIEMIVVPLSETGPDMDLVEQHVQGDELVKGIWCVPRFSNPTGCVYSNETVERFAALRPAAKDFRIYWDNAYAVHELLPVASSSADLPASSPDSLPASTGILNLMDACNATANDNIWYQFCSTSKITFAGGGVAAFASSAENIKSIMDALIIRTIGPDKINQERHLRLLPNLAAVQEHMDKHAAILSPKFAAVDRVLTDQLSEAGIGRWTNPEGGYFISFDGLPRTAIRTVELAEGAGVVLTPAGATYPYGKDPLDANIRIAPSYPSLNELELAAEVLACCILIASLEQLLK